MIKNILLTGATGFIGSHLLSSLLENDYKVVVIKRSFSDIWRIKENLEKIISFDIDKVSLKEIFQKNKIDCIIHLATYYTKSHKGLEDVQAMVDANITFPVSLVETGIKHKVKNFINTGTFFEYKMKDTPVKEGDEISPYNFYASTKIAFNEILKYYSKEHGLHCLDLKLFSPYGEKDNEKLIISLIKLLDTNNKIAFSGGKQKLNFTYVKDIVAAYLKGIKAIESIKGYETYNVGINKAYSIKKLAKYLEKISGKKLNINWGGKPYTENEIFYANCENHKIKEQLGWVPKVSLYEGLEKTYNYYLKNE